MDRVIYTPEEFFLAEEIESKLNEMSDEVFENYLNEDGPTPAAGNKYVNMAKAGLDKAKGYGKTGLDKAKGYGKKGIDLAKANPGKAAAIGAAVLAALMIRKRIKANKQRKREALARMQNDTQKASMQKQIDMLDVQDAKQQERIAQLKAKG